MTFLLYRRCAAVLMRLPRLGDKAGPRLRKKRRNCRARAVLANRFDAGAVRRRRGTVADRGIAKRVEFNTKRRIDRKLYKKLSNEREGGSCPGADGEHIVPQWKNGKITLDAVWTAVNAL